MCHPLLPCMHILCVYSIFHWTSPSWPHNNQFLDGKGLIDVRQLDDVSLDLSDHKCDNRDQICCKRPNYR